jgi:hypothetical protein
MIGKKAGAAIRFAGRVEQGGEQGCQEPAAGYRGELPAYFCSSSG